MRELSVVANIPPISSGNITDQIEDLFVRNPNFPSVAIQSDDEWRTITAAQFRAQVRGVAKGLIAEGLKAGESCQGHGMSGHLQITRFGTQGV